MAELLWKPVLTIGFEIYFFRIFSNIKKRIESKNIGIVSIVTFKLQICIKNPTYTPGAIANNWHFDSIVKSQILFACHFEFGMIYFSSMRIAVSARQISVWCDSLDQTKYMHERSEHLFSCLLTTVTCKRRYFDGTHV